MTGRIAAWIVGALTVALYAYAVFVGVINVLGMTAQGELYDMAVSFVGWAFMIAHLAIPVLALAVAFIVARRSSAWVRVLVLLAGLCVVSVLLLVLTDLETRVLPWQAFFV